MVVVYPHKSDLVVTSGGRAYSLGNKYSTKDYQRQEHLPATRKEETHLMQQEGGHRGGNGLGDFAIEFLKQDARPAAIIRDFRSEGDAEADSHITDTLFENEAFEVLIRAVWTGEAVKSVLDAECPAEVTIADSGMRFRVLNLGGVRGVIALDYPGVGTDPAKKVDYRRIMEILASGGTTGSFVSSSAGSSVISLHTGSGEPSRKWENNLGRETPEDDSPFPYPWGPKQFPRRLAPQNLSSIPTPKGRQKSPATMTSTRSSSAPVFAGRRSATRQIRSTDLSKAIRAAVGYFKQIGHGSQPQQEGEEAGSDSDKSKRPEEGPLLDWTKPNFKPLPQYSTKHYESLRAIDWFVLTPRYISLYYSN